MTTQSNIIKHRHAAEDFNFLKGPGDPELGACRGPELIDLLFFVIDISLLRLVKAVDTVHHHCFPCAVGPDDRMDLSFPDFQANSGKGKNLSKNHVEVLYFKQDVLLRIVIQYDQFL